MNENIDPLEKDPQARELARRLLAADFSAESRIRASLRVQLMRRPSFSWAPALWPSLAAASVLVMIFARQRDVHPVGNAGLPVLSGRFDSTPAPSSQESLFVVVPPHEIATKKGRIVEWNLPEVAFRIETRRITLSEIFENPKSRGAL